MRTPFKPISQPELIRPVATPVNTYVRPADPAPSPLHQLAEGLGDLAGGLSSLVGQRDAKQQEADALKAEALFNENNQVPFAEAVRQGLIPAQASPTFVKTYKQAQGNLAGIQLQQKFTSEYMKWEGRNSNDPAAFQTWMQGFVKDNVDPNVDPDILRGLNPHVRQLWGNGYETFSRDSDASLREGAKSTLGAVANRLADAAETQATAEGQMEPNWDGYWADLMAERDKATASGMRYEDADEALINAVVTKAVETGDSKWLDLMKREVPGKGINYEDLPDFKLAQARAQENISTQKRQAMAERDKLTKEANDKEKDALTAQIYEAISKDPNAEVPEDVLKRVETLGSPTIRKQLAEARTAFSSAEGQEDRSIVLELTRRAVEGDLTLKELQKAIETRQIRSAQTYSNLAATVSQVLKERAAGGGVLSDPISKQAMSTVIERVVQSDKSIARALDGTALSLTDEALQAQDEMRQMLMEWEVANPNVPTMERVQAIKAIRDEMLSRVDEVKGTFQSSGDIAQETLKVEQGKQMDATSGELDAAQRRTAREGEGTGDGSMLDSPAADREVNTLFQGDAPPDLEKVPEGYRKMLEDGAKRLETSPEDLNERVWKRYLEKSGKKVPDAYLKKSSLEDGFGQIMNASLDTGLDDTQKARIAGAAKLLTSFTGPEGTTVDGYNTTLANGKLTGGKVDLVGMTLDQVDALQTEMLKHPDNKWNSSALGQYQIVQKTLRTLKDEMGLTGSEVFDEKLQDQMGLALLDRRGYSKWLAGDMTDEQFVSNLRDEWDGLNRVSKSSLVSALQEVKDGGASAFDSILAQKDTPSGGLADLVKSPTDYKGTGKLRFAHAGQETIQDDLRASLERVSEDLGEPLRITSGYRSPKHPVERRKGNGGGEHTKGEAVDIDLSGYDDAKRERVIRSLMAKGVKRFILYRNSPNMLHVDLRDQRGDGSRHWMYDKSAKNMSRAPEWYRKLAEEDGRVSAV